MPQQRNAVPNYAGCNLLRNCIIHFVQKPPLVQKPSVVSKRLDALDVKTECEQRRRQECDDQIIGRAPSLLAIGRQYAHIGFVQQNFRAVCQGFLVSQAIRQFIAT